MKRDKKLEGIAGFMKIYTKWLISVLAEIPILLPFYLILTRGDFDT